MLELQFQLVSEVDFTSNKLQTMRNLENISHIALNTAIATTY